LLPDPNNLPDPETFAKHVDQIKERKNSQVDIGSEFWTKNDQDEETLKNLARKAQTAAEVFDADQRWVNQFLEIGRLPEQQQKPWYELIDLVDHCCKEIPEKEALVLTHGPKSILSNRMRQTSKSARPS
ncbi:MAG: hypothetical protein IH796_03240, partial [Deltaproteobacteria bacterium]|nr:hypothetical protein [Deltaproteobacteria bacterium]